MLLAEFHIKEVNSEKSLGGLQVEIEGKRESPEMWGLAALKNFGL